MQNLIKSKLSVAVISVLAGASGSAIAQESTEQDELVVVQGIRSALISALGEKRNSKNLTEVIQAEDIGKLPDQNLAEVLENITGVQIDRTNGVGTGVQIRGTSDIRVEINGVATASSGGSRTGISFEDVPAALISSLEVTKVPTAKTVEGSVGGTVNLKTLRGNSLKETLAHVRVQGENSDLADSTTPRVAATFGDNWDTDAGTLGFVITGSYAEVHAASGNPRFDRDRVVLPGDRASSEDFAFFRTQFLDQPILEDNYETQNITTSLEFEPNEDLKFYLDYTYNDQERRQTNSRAFFSGTGNNAVIDNTTNTGFELVDLGSVDSRFGTIDLGEVQVVTSGILGPGFEVNPANGDPNLRTSNGNNTRLTKTNVFALGTEWVQDKITLKGELAYSDAKTDNVSLNSSLDFINPHAIQPSATTSADNATPAEFRIANDTFEFGIAQGLPTTPSTQELLDPANYALRSVGQGLGERESTSTALRVDFTYDSSEDMPLITDLHAGVRLSNTTNSSSNAAFSNSFGGRWDRPTADLFAGIVVPGASNFDVVDGRELTVSDYLIIDNDVSYNNPDFVINTINGAIAQNNTNRGLTGDDAIASLGVPVTAISQFFDIEEDSVALYLQGDYEFDAGSVPVSGNIGLRYVTTDVASTGTSEVNGVVETSVRESSYSFVLPRFNIVAELADNLLLRGGAGQDIRRPNFRDLSPSANFGTSASGTVTIGNPDLVPEEIWSYDLALEYYPTPASIVSLGIFHKERTNLITPIRSEPDEPIGETGQIERDVTDPCEGGGIFNPNVPPENYNVFSSRTDTQGICVASSTSINAAGEETQSGLELAAQYDLADYEDTLGWASGFGVIANYTYQEAGQAVEEFDVASGAINQILGFNSGVTRDDADGSTATLDDDVITRRIGLESLSENSYNFTLFYDKHNLNVRMRYTYRDGFEERLNRMRFNVPPTVGARGQFNMSVNYDIGDNWTVGVEGVNLGREDRTRWCFSEGALLCEQSLSDRRITFGVTARL